MSYSWHDLTEDSWHELTEDSWHDLAPDESPPSTDSTGFYHGFNAMFMAPLHFEGFGETVTLHGFNGDSPMTAIVRLPQQSHLNRFGKEAAITGDVVFDVSAEDSLNTLSGLTIRGKRFEITNVGTPVDGVIKVTVTRTEKEYTNATNALDLL